MKRIHYVSIAVALVLVILIFQLPRVVVENEKVQELTNKEPQQHGMAIPKNVTKKMEELRSFMKEEGNLEKKAKFAHSLARYHLDYGNLDSAVLYANRIKSWKSSFSSVLYSDIYFTAFERAQNQEKAKEYADSSKNELKKLLEKDPSNLDFKNKLAMTLVVSENPMSGIMMLREVLETQPNNRQALLNIGLLSIKSGQFGKAKERFRKLVSLDSTDYEAKLYLAVSLLETSKKTEAKKVLQQIINTQDSIPIIKQMAGDYLKNL